MNKIKMKSPIVLENKENDVDKEIGENLNKPKKMDTIEQDSPIKAKECESPSNLSIQPDIQKLPNIVSFNIDSTKSSNAQNITPNLFQNESIKSIEKKAFRLKDQPLNNQKNSNNSIDNNKKSRNKIKSLKAVELRDRIIESNIITPMKSRISKDVKTYNINNEFARNKLINEINAEQQRIESIQFDSFIEAAMLLNIRYDNSNQRVQNINGIKFKESELHNSK